VCFSSPSIPTPTPPPPIQSAEQDQATLDAIDRERKKRNKGVASTILTSPQGTDMSPTATAPKTLLGA
jgi:hypothetical protein